MPKLLATNSSYIPFLLVILQIACWAEMDLFVPSLPEMMYHFGVTEQVIQLVLSINFLGFFISSLFVGPMADAFGRRPVLLAGAALFAFGGLLAVFAPTIELFLCARLIQGLGVAAPAVVSVAVICDMYNGEKQVKILSLINSIVTITMAVAPIAGAYISAAIGWRANFAVIALLAILGLLAVLFFVPETLNPEQKRTFKVGDLIKNYVRLLKAPQFLGPALSLCAMVTPYFIYIGLIPLLFMDHMNIPMNEYVFYQSAVVGTFSICSLLVPQATKHFDMMSLTRKSLVLASVSAVLLFAHGLLLADNALSITILMSFYAMGLVLVCSVMFVQGVNAFDDLRASASSLLQGMRMLMLAIGTAISGAVYNDTYAPVGTQTVIFVLVGVACCWPFVKSSALQSKNEVTFSAH